ncbi:aldose 1-epimerase [Gluconobacter sp.]|uniref:aldose 1-epimerase n=1 Tax=Gluconobacter sp. TaxID=1876758 RepID=UPI0039EA37C7
MTEASRDVSGMIELVAGEQRAVVLPKLGAALGRWQFRGKDVFLPVANPALVAQRGEAVAAYPLVPYSNRIAQGRFAFEGREYRLAPNMAGDSSAIHGNGWEREWTVTHRTDRDVVLVLEHVPQADDPQWPFAYRAELSYGLRPDGLEVRLVVENRDAGRQPVGLGFHPFLAAKGAATLAFEAQDVWLTTPDALPSRRVPCEGEWAFGRPVDVHARAIDNCFSGFGGRAVLANRETGLSVEVEADRLFGHVVVFTAPDSPFVAVEPVTNMTDAINHPEIADRGLHVLEPEAQVGGSMRFRVEKVDG